MVKCNDADSRENSLLLLTRSSEKDILTTVEMCESV